MTTNTAWLLPEGRLINQALFIKDQYNDKATPCYKLELAFDDKDLDDAEARLMAAAVDKWGAGADQDKNLILPFLDGDTLAAKRESKGKEGDAYKGKVVIRANTIYNSEGNDADGGISVYGIETEPLSIVLGNSKEVYAGCYGYAAVTIGTYTEEKTDNRALKFYLTAFKKSKDGDALSSGSDHSGLFGGTPAAAGRTEGETANRSRGR